LSSFTGSVDDRPPQERGLEPLTTSRRVIAKSRYDSISSYLADSPNNKQEYQDIPLEMDEEIRQELLEAGFDEKLANHFAHLFIRDPVVVYEELLDQVWRV
jgi:glutamate--cysteine ligase catalytic subunit